MSKATTSISIELLDGAVVSATTRVNNALQSIEDKAKHVGENTSFDHFAENIKHGIEDPLHAAGSAVEGLLKSLGPSGAAVAGAAGIFTAIGAAGYEAMEKFAGLGRETENLSLRMGLSTREVGQFTFAAKAAGGDVSTLEKLMRGLTMAVEGTDAKSQAARSTLKGFGVDIGALKDGTASTSDVLMTISQHLADMPNVFERNKVALDLFKRGGIDAIPVLMELNANVQRAKELGVGLSDEEVNKFKLYHQQLTEIGAEWDILKRKMMEPIAGVLSVIIQGVMGDSLLNDPEMRAAGSANWHIGPDGRLVRNGTSNFGGVYYPNVTGKDAPKHLTLFPQGTNDFGFSSPFGNQLGGLVGYQNAGIDLSGLAPGQLARDRATYDATLSGAEGHLRAATEAASRAWDAYNGADKPTKDLRDAWEAAAASVAKYTAQVEALRKPNAGAIVGNPEFPGVRRGQIPSLYGPQWAGMGLSDSIVADTSGWAAQDALISGQYKARMEGQYQADQAQQAADRDAQDRRQKLAEDEQDKYDDLMAKQADSFAHLFVEFTDSARTGGHRGIGGFFRGQANSLENSVIGNAAKWGFSQFIGNEGGPLDSLSGSLSASPILKNLLGGTGLIRPDKPIDPSTLRLQTAGDTLVIAGRDLSAAAQALATGRAAAVPSSAALGTINGSGGWSSPYGTFTNLGPLSSFGNSGVDVIPGGDMPVTSGGWSSYASGGGTSDMAARARSGGSSGPSAFTGMLGKFSSSLKGANGFMGDFGSGMSDPVGMLFGSTGADGSYTGSLTLAQGIGAGVGLAAAGFAAYNGINQITKGGAHNALGGIAQLAGAASIIPGAAVFTAPIALAAGLGSMIFGDPRQQRQSQINQWMQDHRYQGPDPVAYSRNMAGQDISTNLFGNQQTVGGPTTVNIQAMDSKSFNDFLQTPGANQALDKGMNTAIQGGGVTLPTISRQLGLS